MRIIEPLPVPCVDGGADYKTESCAGSCYVRDKDGVPVNSCEFLRVVPGWPVEEFRCTMPDDC